MNAPLFEQLEPRVLLDALEGPSWTPDGIIPEYTEAVVEVRIQNWEDVPEYFWYYGCSPTAGGMLIGWWDAQPGCGYLIGDDINPYDYIASVEHIVAGKEQGYTYGTYMNSTSYPDHMNNPSCIADFMYTNDGGTARGWIGAGMVGFAAWDDPDTIDNESYKATATTYYTAYGWGFADYKAEIDAGRPVHLGITNHSVLAYGYWDNGGDDYGYICYTTWGGWGERLWRWDGVDVPAAKRAYAATYFSVEPDAQGDANHDGLIDGKDLAIWQIHYDPLGTSANSWSTGDWNSDGLVNGGDLALWQQNYSIVVKLTRRSTMSCGERSCKHFAVGCPVIERGVDEYGLMCSVACKRYKWDGKTPPDTRSKNDALYRGITLLRRDRVVNQAIDEVLAKGRG